MQAWGNLAEDLTLLGPAGRKAVTDETGADDPLKLPVLDAIPGVTCSSYCVVQSLCPILRCRCSGRYCLCSVM